MTGSARPSVSGRLALAGVLSVASASSAWAVPILNPDNGHYYELVEHGDLTWQQAKSLAASSSHLGLPGHLVTVGTESEHVFLQTQFASVIGDTDLGRPGLYAWIGLTDEAEEGNWQWVTGEPLLYTAWHVGEPNSNGGNEDYAHYWTRNGSWTWNDAPDTIAGRVYGLHRRVCARTGADFARASDARGHGASAARPSRLILTRSLLIFEKLT